MGAIDIPANPSAPGHLSVRLQLDATEVHSLSSLLQQAVQLVGADPAGASDRLRVLEEPAQTDAQHYVADQIDHDPHALGPAEEPTAGALYAAPEEDQNTAPDTYRSPDNVQHRISSAQGSSSDQGLTSAEPAPAHRQKAWGNNPGQRQQGNEASGYGHSSASRQQPEQQAPKISEQYAVHSSTGRGQPEQQAPKISEEYAVHSSAGRRQPEQQAPKFSEEYGVQPQASRRQPQQQVPKVAEDYDGQPQASLIPAKNSSQDWPTAQQAQAQPPRGNKATYGSTTGNSQWTRPGGKNAGKQVMASRGFVAPIQITRVEWGEPLPNAQDTWGQEEPEPQPLPSAMPAAGLPSVRRQLRPPAAFPPTPGGDPAQMSAPPEPASSAQRAPPAATMHWQRMWTTDSLDHNGDDVRACLHVATMPDLVDESGAGWLITASNNLLNLWGCTCIGSPGEPALQMVHSLDTEFQVSDLQIDPANSLLMAAARDTKALTECVALHHLKLTPGIFRLKGRLGLPVGVTGRLAKNTGSIKALQVQSVHSHQGVLSGCCAASHDRTIAVYPSNVVPGEVAKHKAVWKAHGRAITLLHASRHCPTLLSGDEAGAIYIWNMRSKPSEPEAEVKHEKAVTGIYSTGERSFVSCSLDGRLCVWNFNVGRRPLHTVSAPDNRAILKMAVNKDGLAAFCTPAGLYVVDVTKSSPVHTVAVNQPHEAPTLCLTWNTGTSGQTYLYASNGATLSAYRASQYEQL